MEKVYRFPVSIAVQSGLSLLILISLVISTGFSLASASPQPALAPLIQAENKETPNLKTSLPDGQPNTISTRSDREEPTLSPPENETALLSTFTRDEALESGRRQITLSSSPLHYQDSAGDWQPIDPRFTAAEGGFTNFTNSLRISAAERIPTLNLRNGDTLLQWQSSELVLIPSSGEQKVLAKVLDPASALPGELTEASLTVRYDGSWNRPGVVEEISSAPGMMEQSLVIEDRTAILDFCEPSQIKNKDGDSSKNSNCDAESVVKLSLVATLRLSPGATLFADGELKPGSFSTSESVEIRKGSTTELVIEPVIAYEQDDPTDLIRGSYSFSPSGDGEWQVSVETPLDWWADPGRSYPIVLDPTMKMLSPITTAQLCSSYPSSPCPLTGEDYLLIGRNLENLTGRIEALVRFDQLPTLPPGYVIEKADLLVAPENFTLGTGGTIVKKQVRVHQVTSAWSPATANYNINRPTITNPYLDQESLVVGTKPVIPVAATSFVTRFNLQTGPSGFVSGWLDGSVPNNGLFLYQYPVNLCMNCTDFLKIYTAPTWTKNDYKRLDPENPYNLSASEGSGFMLQITYAPPTLSLNEPLQTSLPAFGKNYADTYHTYLPPASASAWTAIVVKGLNQVQSGEDIIAKASGNLRMAKGCIDPFNPGCTSTPSEGDFKGRPNFIITRGDPSATDLAAWLYPPNPDSPANKDVDSYLIDAVPSVDLAGNPPLLPGTHITLTEVMTTSEIIRVKNLNLTANSRIGVSLFAISNHPSTGDAVEFPFFETRLFRPSGSGNTFVKDLNGQKLGGHTAPGFFEMGSAKVGAAEAGTWALTIEYFGDVNPTFGGGDDPLITSTIPVSSTLFLSLVVCQKNGVPTKDGCITTEKPGINTDFRDVGNFRVFNPAGFNCSGSTCGTVYQPGPGAISASVVWKADWLAGQQDRWVSVAGAPISFDTSTYSFFTTGVTSLVTGPLGNEDPFPLFTGATLGYPDPGISPSNPNFGRLVPLPLVTYDGPPLIPSDVANLQVNVNVDRQVAEAKTTMTRQVLTSPAGLENFVFNLSWEFQAEGYATLSNVNLAPVSVPNDSLVASLTLLFGSDWDVDYSDEYMPNGRFTNLRNAPGTVGDGGVGARVAAPASLGSNWKGVVALLLPVGTDLEDSEGSCPGDCLDIRSSDDTPTTPNRTWDLPDLNIGGAAQTVSLNSPGELIVFSTDHPNSVESVSLPFNFRTFNGEVNVDVKVCPNSGNNEKVVVLTGKSKIALPGLGSDTNPTMMINAEFILCETALRQVILEWHGPPDIPAGSTGVLISMVKGDVQIGPSNTEIEFTLDYHDNSDIVDGTAKVRIDTAGLFDMQTSGDVLTKVDYNGHAWVSWNPLDVGVDVNATYSSWLSGKVHAHLWKGQGWQNKYSWLPNNNETHFAGSINAMIYIDQGQAFSWEFIDIPPWDISFSITVAFGQFCQSSGCSKYEWGIKGKFEVIGFDVGFFYGFKSGFHFILGSDGHILIDQYGPGSTASLNTSKNRNVVSDFSSVMDTTGGGMIAERGPQSAGTPLGLTRLAVPDPLAPELTHPLNVTAFTGSFTAGLTWSQGAPVLTLIRPDLVEITPANATSYGVSIAATLNSILYGMPQPMVGTWQAKIENTAANNDYHFIWFANKAIPAGLQLNSPFGDVFLLDNTTPYNLSWDVPAQPPAVDLRVSLFYTVTNSTALTETQQLGGVIRENLALSDGSYSWDLSSLAFGDYHVYARVYSGQPGSEPIQPEVTITGTNQIPGDFWMNAPGVIHLQDSVAPATPTGFAMVPIAEGFFGCWNHNVEKDLAGYIVRYISPDVYGTTHQHDLRIQAQVSDPNNWMQCARLGGFNVGENIQAQIAAYDASGNLSPFSNLDEAVVDDGVPADVPDPGPLSVVVVSTTEVNLSWPAQVLPPGSGYWLYYSKGRPLGIGQVDPPFDLGFTNEISLSMLEPGFVWFFMLQTHDDWARLSRSSNWVAALVSDYQDEDGDGLPDDWEAAHEVGDPAGDEDGDGLQNLLEFQRLTHPQIADTDGDGFSDGEEEVGGSSALDASSTPATYENFVSGVVPLPDLMVDPQHLTFRAHTLGSNPVPQVVNIFNLGGGVLLLDIFSDAAWLSAQLEGEYLQVLVDKNDLPAGHYTGVITISGDPRSFTQNSPQNVVVDLWLLEGDSPDLLQIYLPLVMK